MDNEKRNCPICGQEVDDGTNFCTACGYAFNDEKAAEVVETQVNVLEDAVDPDMLAFIGSNQESYIKKFKNMDVTNSKASWNWCAFLFGASWFAYRKMLGVSIVLALALELMRCIPTIGNVLSLITFILTGIFANYYYKQYVEKELNMAKSMSEADKAIYISKKGGTSVGLVFAFIGIMFAIEIVIGLIGVNAGLISL